MSEDSQSKEEIYIKLWKKQGLSPLGIPFVGYWPLSFPRHQVPKYNLSSLLNENFILIPNSLWKHAQQKTYTKGLFLEIEVFG